MAGKTSELSIENVLAEYRSLVYKAIRKKGVVGDLADDLAQEIFIVIYKKYNLYNKTKGSLASWIWTVASNKCLDFFKSKTQKNSKKNTQIYEGYNDKHSDNYADTSLEQEMNMAVINRILSQINERQASIIKMIYMGGMSYKEVSTALELPINRIGVEKSRGIEKISSIAKKLGYTKTMFF